MNINIEERVKKCLQKDMEIIEELNKLKSDVNDHHTRCNEFKTWGTVAGAAGTGIFVSSLLLAPFTDGVSLSVCLRGAALSVTGGVINTVTDFVDSSKTKKIVSNIKDIVKSKIQSDEELNEQIEYFTQVIEQLISSGDSHGISAVSAQLRAVANGKVDIKEAAKNPNIYRIPTLASSLFQAEIVTLRSQPLIDKSLQLSENNNQFINTFFGIPGKSTANALNTFGKITAVASIAFTVLDVALLIRDWNRVHPTIEVIRDVQDQLRKEMKRLEKLIDVLNEFQYKVRYNEHLNQFPRVSASVTEMMSNEKVFFC